MEATNGSKLRSDISLGQLWLDMLEFYAYAFNYGETVICVRSPKKVLRSDKNWGSRRVAIEDPHHTNVNLGSPLNTSQGFDYFVTCIRDAFFYFWTPQTRNGPLFLQLVPHAGEHTESNPMVLTAAQARARMSLLKRDDFNWVFHPDKFLGKNRLPVTCSVCAKSGHIKSSCPELEVPKVGHIPPPEYGYLALLEKTCWKIFEDFSQQEAHKANR